ncbi:MAG TPA: VOC family protein [Microvirga sp.]|jgi:catechol 2,3-dioxygenase-like lactoylglutathione lyase family enzyme|nr:VOC family protein [Microvirga sp.]
MNQSIATVTFLVRDYDEAICWFTGALNFRLISDAPQGDGKRWVLVAPAGVGTTRLLLAKAADRAQEALVGRQAAGRVFLFLETDDFERDHANMRAKGVTFREGPRVEPYGTVAVFEDLYGNPWDLIQPRRQA